MDSLLLYIFLSMLQRSKLYSNNFSVNSKMDFPPLSYVCFKREKPLHLQQYAILRLDLYL
ncbi:hypothetical protein BDF14DRAFT_1822226 [Spinellus fusiger]|nr:hypothetical protein BDF14DRAFT_1822226 [Spinellus fusiger]